MAREETKAKLRQILRDIAALPVADLKPSDMAVIQRAAQLKDNERGYQNLEEEIDRDTAARAPPG